MGVTIGVLPLLAYAYGKGDRERLLSALRASAITVGVVVVIFSSAVYLFRHQVFSMFSADRAVVAIGITILTAQLAATFVNGFTGLIKSLFQATGRATPTIVLSVAQGILFVPIVILGNHLFGLSGIIWSLTLSEGIVFLVAVAMWITARSSIDRGLAEGSLERAEEVLEQGEG